MWVGGRISAALKSDAAAMFDDDRVVGWRVAGDLLKCLGDLRAGNTAAHGMSGHNKPALAVYVLIE